MIGMPLTAVIIAPTGIFASAAGVSGWTSVIWTPFGAAGVWPEEPLIACAANFLCDGEGEKNAKESVYSEFKQPKKNRGKKACFDGKIGTKHGV